MGGVALVGVATVGGALGGVWVTGGGVGVAGFWGLGDADDLGTGEADLGGVGDDPLLALEETLDSLTAFWGMIGATWAVVGRGGPTTGLAEA